jgi:hypothetical protein
MADGDIVHGQPNFYYKKPYEALCEGRSDSSWLVLGALQKQIKTLGNSPLILIKQTAQYLAQEIQKGQTNWKTLIKELEQIKNQYLNSIEHYCLSIIWQSIKRIFHEFKYKDRTETHNLLQVMIRQYMEEL